VERMTLATGAMRQGILWDMIGRAHHKDMREVTVRQFMKRYHVEADHAHRVERLAQQLFRQIAGGNPKDDAYARQLLSWASRLQEIGFSVAHSGYHKHSAYILANADMPGFSRMEQQHLSLVALAHRGSLDKVRALVTGDPDWTLLVALRLAVLFHRSRSDVKLPRIRASRRKRSHTIEVDARWLADNPLTTAELRAEVKGWARLGIELNIPQLAETESADEAMAD
jgi:exopolyphosphatase / guanosine-5'-triphosphate,3'-diphosphate pyrophosphatase